MYYMMQALQSPNISTLLRDNATQMLDDLNYDGITPIVCSVCCDAEDGKEPELDDYWLVLGWPKHTMVHLYDNGSSAIIQGTFVTHFSEKEFQKAIKVLKQRINSLIEPSS